MSDHDITDEDIAAWDLPFLEDDTPASEHVTNAFNRKSNWKYEPPEEQPEEILPPTAEEIAEIRQAAYQEGFEQGKLEGNEVGHAEGKQQGYDEGKEQGIKEGTEEGLQAGQETLNAQLDTLQSVLDNLHQPTSQVNDQLKAELVKLSVSLARAVIRTEVNSNQDIVTGALNAGLKTLPIKENEYQISMHPEDVALIKSLYSEQQIEKSHWVFIDNPTMSRGGCDISTTSNAVDVSIERRSRDVLDRFLLEQGLTDIDLDR